MKTNFLRLIVLTILFGATGCGMLTSKGEKAIREMLEAMNDLRDTLQTVQDANSANAATNNLDAKYARWIDSIAEFRKHTKDKVLKSTLDDLTKQLQEVQSQLKSEGERLTKVRGLPIQFWKIAKVRSGELMIQSLEMLNESQGNLEYDSQQWLNDFQELWKVNGYENVIQMELDNLPFNLTSKAHDKIQQAAPGAKVLHFSNGNKCSVGLGPVKDYQAFLKKLDLGTVTFEDEPQRTIHITVDRRKLGALGNSDEEEAELQQKKHEEEFQKHVQESQAQAAKHFTEAVQEQKKLTERVPARDDPEYFEKLADQMIDSRHFHKEEAIDALLNATPSEVSSAETRKKIARNFKKIAENGSVFDKKKAVKGLVIWGGKYSTPILLKMLDEERHSDQNEIIKGLGELKDPQAAEALAARLGDFFTHEAAYAALKQIGSGAEDALLAVGPSNDAKICLAAITLLGDAGTDKSLPFLREAQSSRNPDVRLAAKASVRKIMVRKNAARSGKS